MLVSLMLWCVARRKPPSGIDHRNTDLRTIEGQGHWAGVLIEAPDFSDAGHTHDAHHDRQITVLGFTAPPVNAGMVVMADHVFPEDQYIVGLGAVHDLRPVPAFRQAPDCGKACKDDPLGGKSASSLTHLVWLQKLLFVVQRWKGKRG